MGGNDYPVLCGGTFFTLLLLAKKQSPKARERLAGKENEFSEPNILIGLLKVCYPEYIGPNESEKDHSKQ